MARPSVLASWNALACGYANDGIRTGADTEMARVYELPGERITSLDDFWVAIGEAINGPGGYFGTNLDAFVDCLRGGMGTPLPGGYTIRWVNADLSRIALGYPETVRQLQRRLETCHPTNRLRVSSELSAAKYGRGPTVFDWLVDIINRESTAKLELR